MEVKFQFFLQNKQRALIVEVLGPMIQMMYKHVQPVKEKDIQLENNK